MTTRNHASFLPSFLIYLLLVPALVAQDRTTGRIRGMVTDSTDAVLPGVKVTVTNTQSGTTQHVFTNQSGSYEVPYLAPGPYSVAFELTSFKMLVRTGIELQLDQVARVDARLEVGETRQTVSVTENAPLIDTETSERRMQFGGTVGGPLLRKRQR